MIVVSIEGEPWILLESCLEELLTWEGKLFLPYLITWTELKLDSDTAFSDGRLLEVAMQRLSFMMSDLPTLLLTVFFQVSAAPMCLFVYTHTACSTSKQKSALWYSFFWRGWYFSPSATCSFCIISSVVSHWVVFSGWVLEHSELAVEVS